MTKFIDGPAEGQTLMLQRAPIFLRAVQDQKKEWDALDQLHDTVADGETVYVYVLDREPGRCHVLRRGKGQQSGWYTVATYRLHIEQPSQEILSSTIGWRKWVQTQPVPDLKGLEL